MNVLNDVILCSARHEFSKECVQSSVIFQHIIDNMHRNFTMVPATVICVESQLSTSPYMDPTNVQVIFITHIFKMGAKTTSSVNLF